MKKLFGKVLVGAVGFVMALGMTAFAANEITNIQITPDPDTGKVVISGQITGDAVSPESTILVAPENTSLAEVKDDNIRYIDQQTAASGEFRYEFTLDKGNVYNVWFGATDIAAATEAQHIDLTGKTTGTFSIIGKVSLVEGPTPEENYKKLEVSAIDTTSKASTAGKVDAANKSFTVEVAPGTYDVVVGRPGYLYVTVTAKVEGADYNIPEVVAPVAGNYVVETGEGIAERINSEDLNVVLVNYLKKTSEEGYVAAADVNDDGVLNSEDLNVVLVNYLKQAE